MNYKQKKQERWGAGVTYRYKGWGRPGYQIGTHDQLVMGNKIHAIVHDEVGVALNEIPIEFMVDCTDKTKLLRLSNINLDWLRTKCMLLPNGGKFRIKAGYTHLSSIKKSVGREAMLHLGGGVALTCKMLTMKPGVWELQVIKLSALPIM